MAMTRSRSRFIKGAALVVLLGGGLAYFAVRRAGSDAPVTFRVAKLDKGSIEQVVTATGQLYAVVTVQVGSQISGIIESLSADFNSKVKEGQVIAKIEQTKFKANLAQAQASLKNAEAQAAKGKVDYDLAKREYERGQELVAKQVIGASELDGLKSKYDLARVEMLAADAGVAQARASVGMAQVDLEHTIIKSPISGTVLQRAVDVGQTVAAAMSAPVIFTIAQDLAKMEVRAAIDEADVGKLHEGLDAHFTVDAYPGREFVATIYQVRSNPNVVQNVVTYDAILRVDNPDGKLRPGMTASVRIVTEKRDNVLRIPNAALRFKPPAELVLASTGNPWGGGRGDGGMPAEFRRRGEADGGAPGGEVAGGPPPGAGGPGPGVALGRAGGGGFGGPGGRMGGGRGGRGDARVPTRVYRAEGEKLAVVPFRPGISDEQYTEVVRSQLKEGDEIVIEATGAGITQVKPAQATPPGGAAGRGRGGPRFF